MDLRQLEYFVAVHETANFTRAAERVHISQSGVSSQIRQLEKELGHPLFDRSGKTVLLTDAGIAVLPHALAALAAIDGIRQAVDELTGLLHGHVAVGMVTACSVPVLFDQLADFHRTNPGIDITLSEDTSDRLVDRVVSGQLNMALVGLSGPPPVGIESLTMADEPLIAAVPHDDPLDRRKTIPLQLLKDRDLVCLPEAPACAQPSTVPACPKLAPASHWKRAPPPAPPPRGRGSPPLERPPARRDAARDDPTSNFRLRLWKADPDPPPPQGALPPNLTLEPPAPRNEEARSSPTR